MRFKSMLIAGAMLVGYGGLLLGVVPIQPEFRGRGISSDFSLASVPHD